jgi:hypothetical protein
MFHSFAKDKTKKIILESQDDDALLCQELRELTYGVKQEKVKEGCK